MKYLISTIIILSFLSCSNNKKVHNINERIYDFFETGEIYSEKEIISEDTIYNRYFSKTGKIQFEGMTVNSENEGIWRWYHSDGAICAMADFHKGDIVDLEKIISENKYFILFEIEGNPKEIKIGNSYRFRFRIVNLWYHSVEFLTEILGIIKAENVPYPYEFTPRKKGIAYINLNITDKEYNILKTIPYEIKVE